MARKEQPDALDVRILELLARGYDDARVGYRVGLSHRSVQRRVQWLMTYLGANGRVALGAKAHAVGLLTVCLGPGVKASRAAGRMAESAASRSSTRTSRRAACGPTA